MVTMIVAALQALAALPKMGEQIRAVITGVIMLWTEREIAKMNEENRLALRKALDEHDQRDLEKALGNKDPGRKSDVPGARVVTSIPGVRDSKGS